MSEKSHLTTSSLRPYKRYRTELPPLPCPTCPTQAITTNLDNLPVEIILRIVEEMGWDPVTIGFFMRTNHAIFDAICANEISLSVRFTKQITSGTYQNSLLSTAPSRITFMESSPFESTLRRLICKLSFTSIPSFPHFLKHFNTSMQTHHPALYTGPLDEPMRVHRAFIDAIEALEWAHDHNLKLSKLPFEVRPKIAKCVKRQEFEWVEEVHIREKIKDELPKANLFDLKRMEIAAIFQAQPQLCHCCHEEAYNAHIAKGVELLYRMWDARLSTFREGRESRPPPSQCSKWACNAPSECAARDNVEGWIQLQDAETLAHLLEVIWIASQLYDYNGMNLADFRGCEHASDQTVASHTIGHNNTTDPTRSLNERGQHWDRVEMECIFRELCLESGPAFLYACRSPPERGTTKEAEKRQWAIQLMQRGIQRLHAYEAGEIVDAEDSTPPDATLPAGTDGHAESSNGHQTTLPSIIHQSSSVTRYAPRKTLQATILQKFCHLRQCDLRMGWDEVFHVNAVVIDKIRSRMEEEKEKKEKEEEGRKREEEMLRLAGSSAIALDRGKLVNARLLGAADASQDHDSDAGCVVGAVDGWSNGSLGKDGWTPERFHGSENAEGLDVEPLTAKSKQQSPRRAF